MTGAPRSRAERHAGKGSAIRGGWREADPSPYWLASLVLPRQQGARAIEVPIN
jgi:hypothetical protein